METSCPRLLVISLMVVLSNGVLVVMALAPSPSPSPLPSPSSSTPQFTAMFAFGDSLTDNGNNNYLSSIAKANYVPYGVDFYEGPSGRFSNGRTIIDYLAYFLEKYYFITTIQLHCQNFVFVGDLLQIPSYLPAYANPLATGRNILNGVNYASAAAGILEETGRNLGERFSLSQQVQNFENTLNQLKNQMSEQELREYLKKALVVMILGSNDYLNNYLVPYTYPTSFIYNATAYADLLIQRYARQILALNSLGLRKFLLGGIGPLGCIPNQLATGLAPTGKCVAYVNNIVGMFNTRLRSLVDQLNSKHYPDAIFAFGNTFGAFGDILNNPTAYGKTSKIHILWYVAFGFELNRIYNHFQQNQYVFWDAFHPTQAANEILARKAYSGPPSDCYPINVQQMALM
ncbi:hypothetical protein HYC85_001924 [Camellia sinensis]|uniref:GDSL esterase/lipase n=1 Tax=Camellia sinensis TaxID=4442 RepID=A0A7J7I7C0_CAMSI|nr:hypothetical protein HYC85_001924 [Camellia sinensis]